MSQDNEPESFPQMNEFHTDLPDSDGENNSRNSQPLQIGNDQFQNFSEENQNYIDSIQQEQNNGDQNRQRQISDLENIEQEQEQEEQKQDINIDNDNNNDDNEGEEEQHIEEKDGSVNVQEKIQFWENKSKQLNQQQFKKDLNEPKQFDAFVPLQESRQIEIGIKKAVQKNTTISKYTAYIIFIKEEGKESEVYRRYNEFEALRKTLIEFYPGCFIPQIPDKQIVNVTEYAITKFRTKVFNGFLKKIAENNLLFKSEPVQVFLFSTEVDCKKQLELLPRPNTQKLFDQIVENFNSFVDKEITPEIEEQRNHFMKNLDIASPKLKLIINHLTQLADIKDNHNKNLTSLFEFCLNDYEKQNIIEYTGMEQRLIISNKDLPEFQKLKEQIMKQGTFNPYRQILECLQSELLDVEGLREVYESKKTLIKHIKQNDGIISKNDEEIKKLSNGKKGISGLFTSKTPEVRIKDMEQQNNQLNQEKANFQKLSNIQDLIFVQLSMKQFRESKQTTYKKIMELVSKTEINKSVDQMKFWQQFGQYAGEMSKIQPPKDNNQSQ